MNPPDPFTIVEVPPNAGIKLSFAPVNINIDLDVKLVFSIL